MTSNSPHLVVIGSGWAGYYIAQYIDTSLYSVTVISPRRTSAYTPLLASAAVGLYPFSCAEEPIRQKGRKVTFVKADALSVDFDTKIILCRPAFEEDQSIANRRFEIGYDILILCPGSIVGGGPTGVEITAELSDLSKEELRDLYPTVAPLLRISLFDVAPHILGAYDQKLYEYATEQIVKHGVEVRTNSIIEKVDDTSLHIKDQGAVPYGILLWVAGNKSLEFVDNLSRVKKSTRGLVRILTDPKLRVKQFVPEGSAHPEEVFSSVFALGDAAEVEGLPLPTTAEVAVQQARYLISELNRGFNVAADAAQSNGNGWKTFEYSNKSLVSYIGSHKGIVEGQSAAKLWSGSSAWIRWRGGSFYWTRSWRNWIAIILAWVLNLLLGKDVTRL